MRLVLALALVVGCQSETLDDTSDVSPDTDTTDIDTEADTAADVLPDHIVSEDVGRGFQLLGVNTALVTIDPAKSWPATGTGSVRMETGTGSDSLGGDWPSWEGAGGKAFLGTSLWNEIAVEDIDTLRYTTWIEVDSELVPYINLFVDLDGDGEFSADVDDIWAFDPAFASSAAIGGTWQVWDAHTQGHWRCVFHHSALEDGTCGTANDLLLADLVAGQPDATVVSAPCGEAPYPNAGDCSSEQEDAPGLLFAGGQKSGGGWASWVGYIDGIDLEPGGPGQAYDFEP